MFMDKKEGLDEIVERRDIYYPAFGIYGEIAGFYDFGPSRTTWDT